MCFRCVTCCSRPLVCGAGRACGRVGWEGGGEGVKVEVVVGFGWWWWLLVVKVQVVVVGGVVVVVVVVVSDGVVGGGGGGW